MGIGRLHKRDISSGLMDYLKLMLGQAPLGAGDVFFLADSATKYYTKLMNMGVPSDKLFTTLSGAKAAMQTANGDNLLIFPGSFVSTASLTWDLDDTNIIGMGGRNQAYQPGVLTTGGVRLTNTTANVTQILNVTGHYVSMFNIGTFNNAGTANLSDVRITGKNFYGYGCSFRGGNTATGQLDTDGAGLALIFDTTGNGGANAALLERCVIGSSGNGVRSKGPGCVKFLGPGANAGFGIHFLTCTFSARVEIATADNVGLIDISGNGAVDRELLFDNCNFYNFVQGLGTGPTYVIRDSCATTHLVVIHNSSYNRGFTSWSDAAGFVSVSTPASNLVGGLGLNA